MYLHQDHSQLGWMSTSLICVNLTCSRSRGDGVQPQPKWEFPSEKNGLRLSPIFFGWVDSILSLLYLHHTCVTQLGEFQCLELPLDVWSFHCYLRLTDVQCRAPVHLVTVNGSFLINTNCDQQVDIHWINLFYHIGMNPKHDDFAVIDCNKWIKRMPKNQHHNDTFNLCFIRSVGQTTSNQLLKFLLPEWSEDRPEQFVLRLISTTYQAVWLPHSHSSMTALYLSCLGTSKHTAQGVSPTYTHVTCLLCFVDTWVYCCV